MQKQDRKNSLLLRFLEADHSIFARSLFCGLAILVVFPITVNWCLVKDSAFGALKRHNLKRTMRLLSWYAKFGWPRFTFVDDSFFAVTETMTIETLNSLSIYWNTRKDKISSIDYNLEKLRIIGAMLDIQVKSGEIDIALQREFKLLANELIQDHFYRLNNEDTFEPRVPPRKVSQDFGVESAVSVLQDFSKLVPVSKFQWFVIAGTFLGLFREQRFLPYDLDIDLGLFWDPNVHEELIRILQGSKEFSIQKIETQDCFDVEGVTSSQVVFIKLNHRSNITIDIFYHIEGEQFVWHGSALHRWVNTLFSLTTYNLHDVVVLGPEDGDRYLSETYGNWRIPI